MKRIRAGFEPPWSGPSSTIVPRRPVRWLIEISGRVLYRQSSARNQPHDAAQIWRDLAIFEMARQQRAEIFAPPFLELLPSLNSFLP
jgi:hypothetical protein